MQVRENDVTHTTIKNISSEYNDNMHLQTLFNIIKTPQQSLTETHKYRSTKSKQQTLPSTWKAVRQLQLQDRPGRLQQTRPVDRPPPAVVVSGSQSCRRLGSSSGMLLSTAYRYNRKAAHLPRRSALWPRKPDVAVCRIPPLRLSADRQNNTNWFSVVHCNMRSQSGTISQHEPMYLDLFIAIKLALYINVQADTHAYTLFSKTNGTYIGETL